MTACTAGCLNGRSFRDLFSTHDPTQMDAVPMHTLLYHGQGSPLSLSFERNIAISDSEEQRLMS